VRPASPAPFCACMHAAAGLDAAVLMGLLCGLRGRLLLNCDRAQLLNMTDEECSQPETLSVWKVIVDASILECVFRMGRRGGRLLRQDCYKTSSHFPRCRQEVGVSITPYGIGGRTVTTITGEQLKSCLAGPS
jgi:hypothetical protein